MEVGKNSIHIYSKNMDSYTQEKLRFDPETFRIKRMKKEELASRNCLGCNSLKSNLKDFKGESTWKITYIESLL